MKMADRFAFLIIRLFITTFEESIVKILVRPLPSMIWLLPLIDKFLLVISILERFLSFSLS